jgi:hypothetical protein
MLRLCCSNGAAWKGCPAQRRNRNPLKMLDISGEFVAGLAKGLIYAAA